MPTSEAPRARPVFLPALLGAVAVMAGLAFVDWDGYTVIRYVVSIFALIVAVLSVQHGSWPWAPALAVVAVLWNPVLPFSFDGTAWAAGHIVAAAVFVGAAMFVREKPASATR